MSESVIYDARFLCDVRLSSLRASSHCLNLHPISPWPKPWTQTSTSAKTTLRSKTACGMTGLSFNTNAKHEWGHEFETQIYVMVVIFLHRHELALIEYF